MTTAIAPAYGTAEWQADRRNYIGASDMPKLCGVSPYGGPLDLYYEKKGLIVVEENAAVRRGHIYEPAIAAEYAMLYPDARLESSSTIAHPDAGWLRATIDRIAVTAYGAHGVEIKLVTPRQIDRYGPTGSDEVPDDKLVQVQTQMLVLDLPMVHLVVNFGFETRVFPIARDRETQQMLFDSAHEFWHKYILADVEPAPVIGRDSETVMKKKYSTHTDGVVDADELAAAVIAAFAKAKADKKDAEDREDTARQQLMAIIGHHAALDGAAAGRVSWTETKGKASFDVEGLIRDLKIPEDVTQRYTRVGAPYRTMRYSPSKQRKS